jgi:diphosphomevalonate decarboxylase
MIVESEANTMQALVKYHGLKNWHLRIPFHDSISVNTTSLFTRTRIFEGKRGVSILVDGMPSPTARKRVGNLIHELAQGGEETRPLRIVSRNLPHLKAKGLGFSSSAGAALALGLYRTLVDGRPDFRELSKIARLFAASASRAAVGGFSRLYVGKGHDDTFAEKIGDQRTMDLRMVIVPLPSNVRTEEAHREVGSSPFFRARVASAQKRCDEMESAIRKGDLKRLGELTEADTLELHAVTMTGRGRLMIMTADSLKVLSKVRELRSEGRDAYFSMQTGPSVFVNTSKRDQERVKKAISKLSFETIESSVGPEARLVTQRHISKLSNKTGQ